MVSYSRGLPGIAPSPLCGAYFFLGQPCRVGKRLPYIPKFEVRIVRRNSIQGGSNVFRSNASVSYGFGKTRARHRFCHPEAQPKDLGTEGEISLLRSPDPSLRCAPFRMTNGSARINPNPYQRSSAVPIEGNVLPPAAIHSPRGCPSPGSGNGHNESRLLFDNLFGNGNAGRPRAVCGSMKRA